MYRMFIGLTLMPIFPETISIKTGNLNKTVTLINEGEINIEKTPGLKEFSFELTLPNVRYPFAVYQRGFQPASYFLEKLENMKKAKAPDILLISRVGYSGSYIHDTDLWVTLEEMTVKDDVREGLDRVVSLKFKEHRDYGVQTYTINKNNTVKKNSTPRNSSSSPAPKNTNKTYVVQSGDCLWNIAKLFYGDGSKYTVIRDANKNLIAKHGGDANLIMAGDKLVIPAI